MKRFTAAALAATTTLTMTVAPAYAAEGDPTKPNSSEAYQECLKTADQLEKEAKANGTLEEFERQREQGGRDRGFSGSSNEGMCIGYATNHDPGGIALLTILPLTLVALIGGGIYAAASGLIPGVALPAIPGLPL